MGEVIDLPSRAEQGLAYLESEIRKMMTQAGDSEEAIEIALNTLKDVYQRYGDLGQKHFTVTLPASLSDEQREAVRAQISQGLETMLTHHSHTINRLAAELVITKIKLFEYQQATQQDND